MKSIKLRVLFLAVSFFSFSAIFAQDSTNKQKPDSSKMPKHDSTTMIKNQRSGSLLNSDATEVTSFLVKNESKVEAKKEEKAN